MMKLFRALFLAMSRLPMPGHKWRPLFCKLGGVKILDFRHTFIGQNVVLDSVHPELITIHSGVRITSGAIILTHYYNPKTGHYTKGEVTLGEKAFIGAGAMIIKPVAVGDFATLGAGSVLTKNISDYEVWAGNPAKCIGDSRS